MTDELYNTEYLNTLPTRNKRKLFTILLNYVRNNEYEKLCQLLKKQTKSRKSDPFYDKMYGDNCDIKIFGCTIEDFTNIIIKSNIIEYVFESDKSIIKEILNIIIGIPVGDFHSKGKGLAMKELIDEYRIYLCDIFQSLISILIRSNITDDNKLEIMSMHLKVYWDQHYNNYGKHYGDPCNIPQYVRHDLKVHMIFAILNCADEKLFLKILEYKSDDMDCVNMMSYPNIYLLEKIRSLTKRYDSEKLMKNKKLIKLILGNSKDEYNKYFKDNKNKYDLIDDEIHIYDCADKKPCILYGDTEIIKSCIELFIEQFEIKIENKIIKQISI
ncbi:MAG: hypothetical protein Edafosvirus20_5 [Edafosvirus sp.]|uniref:Uncharacterized protein n=1 Tax=Edafosvirus sp. TaxID=2487765 RepID=A0A3G4ZUN0_9VIRU|nr:MAG: hypothetical protein Edafosvirus20_5 [Edafosvirus sp.]